MKKLLLALALFLLPISAEAASRFWVGGTGAWDNVTTTHWSATTGGAGGASAPTTGDSVTFDGASGGGTVTPAANISGLSLAQITMTAFTGTLDFSANNPNLTLTGNGFTVGNGAEGTRTLNLGSGTFTITGVNANVWDATSVASLTFNAGTSTILMQPGAFNNTTFVTGGKTYATVTFGPSAFQTAIAVTGNGATFGNLNINGVAQVRLPSLTITNAIAWVGTSSAPIVVFNQTAGSVSTLTLSAAGGTAQWAALGGITFATNNMTANNSFSIGNMTNATINNPSVGGGGGHIIGG